MKAIDRTLTLAERTKVLGLNIIIFYGLFFAVTKNYFPTGGIESVWLLCAISMWFVTLLSSPWFLPPRDSLTNSVAVATILFTLEISSATQLESDLNIARWIAIAYVSFIAIAALLALFFHDRNRDLIYGTLLFKVSSTFGSAKLIYTIPALISIIDTYQTNITIMTFLIGTWVLYITVDPVFELMGIYKLYDLKKNHSAEFSAIGIISRIDHPNVIRISLTNPSAWTKNKIFKAVMPTGESKYVIPLFKQIQGEEILGTGLCSSNSEGDTSGTVGYVYMKDDEVPSDEIIAKISGESGSQIIGITFEGSSIGTLRFQLAEDVEISEGDVVFAVIRGKDVFYQITDALTMEENFDKNPLGTQIVEATQLGNYDKTGGFTKFSWLPNMNSPIFLANNRDFKSAITNPSEFFIGKVPSTNLLIPANIDEIIVYHTAILGVTGTGKTELALEIVREAVNKGKKVFCVDFTGEYKERLKDLNPVFPTLTKEECTELEQKIFDAETGEYGAGKEKRFLKSAIDTFKKSTQIQISQFLESNNNNLAILELLEITNTKATLRLTELYLSTIMDWAKEHRQARQILLALEEAHTIIPESIGSGFDAGTQSVVSRIGQIALQGRKYGVGLLVISQRTALVSKTILSQCNTFFTHCLIDQTSLNFLESVYSKEHTHLIPNLPNLHFLASGKAIKSDRPILLCKDFDQLKLDATNKLKVQI